MITSKGLCLKAAWLTPCLVSRAQNNSPYALTIKNLTKRTQKNDHPCFLLTLTHKRTVNSRSFLSLECTICSKNTEKFYNMYKKREPKSLPLIWVFLNNKSPFFVHTREILIPPPILNSYIGKTTIESFIGKMNNLVGKTKKEHPNAQTENRKDTNNSMPLWWKSFTIKNGKRVKVKQSLILNFAFLL